MTQKRGRNYRLTIDAKDGLPPIVIKMPLTIQFWVERTRTASVNKFSIDIFNLSQEHRRRIFQDRFNYEQVLINGTPSGWRTILLESGYSQLYTIFSGNIFEASSAREGTEIITRIEGKTGIFDINATVINESFAAGQTQAQLFTYLIGKFPTLTVGAIGNFPTVFNRPVALNGPVWTILQSYVGSGKLYVDNGKVFILNDNEELIKPILAINDSTGILQTPRRDQGSIMVTTLFEPSADLGQPVILNSTVEPVYNGNYSIWGVAHSGIISAAVSGDLRTDITMLAPLPIAYNKVKST